jgi:hypothetical protein
MTQELLVIVMAVAAGTALTALSQRGAQKVRQWATERDALKIKLIQAENRLASAVEKLELMPGYVKGQAEVAERMVLAMEKNAAAVDRFVALVHGRQAEGDATAYDEAAASLSWTRQEYMAQGRTFEQADVLAREEEAKRIVGFPDSGVSL